ncbi:uncharacterized protein LOC110917721 [Helianthus annuus]|uniref:uncharacterized protein LOC110917721 n=1 Tax=Helianthus annuus TaxID=4232 RepID=UPI000B907EA2|nr:uncharacterized protein LOC110917721 [Helianthus annuus]
MKMKMHCLRVGFLKILNLNIVRHNLSPVFAFNEDEDALFESRVVKDPEPISSEFPVLNQNGTNDDEDGVQNFTFTQFHTTSDSDLVQVVEVTVVPPTGKPLSSYLAVVVHE